MIGQLIGGAPIAGSEQAGETSGISGDLSAIESGSDTIAASGQVIVSGAISATEAGSDTIESLGAVLVAGSLSASESGTDTISSSGSVIVSGSLSADESGSDTFSAVGGSVTITTGSLSPTESGSDTFAAVGSVIVSGAVSATESGADTLSSSGVTLVSGALASTESGSDAFVALGFGGEVAGSLNASEDDPDTFFATNVDPSVGGRGFTIVDTPSRLWWKRKPKALPEEEAQEQVARVVRVIERVAKKQVQAEQPVKFTQQKAEVRQAIAPMVEQMPGFDWMAVYTAVLDGLKRQEAQRIAISEIERIRQIESEEDDLLILMMGI